MSDNNTSKDGMDTSENLSREQLREGDSPRAKVYRRKDELLNFSYDKLMTFMQAHSEESPGLGLNDHLAGVHKSLQEINKDPNNEALAAEIVSKLETVHKILVDNGFEV